MGIAAIIEQVDKTKKRLKWIAENRAILDTASVHLWTSNAFHLWMLIFFLFGYK
jgi:hypothetical protein